MARVTDIVSSSGTRPVFMCDFSPPRDPSSNWLDEASTLSPDLFSIPYLAPIPTRPDPITAASLIRNHTHTEAVFNLATRDSHRMKLRDRLACAREMGLQNVVVLEGDAHRGVAGVSSSQRFTPTGLIRELKGPGWDFCAGAVADLGKGVEKEADLARRKVDLGAEFLLVQPTFNLEAAEEFLARADVSIPVFFGVQVLVGGGIAFTPTPDALRHRIERNNAGVDVAVETIQRFRKLGIRCFYLIPPIYPGGSRDYAMACRVMDSPTLRPAPDSPV